MGGIRTVGLGQNYMSASEAARELGVTGACVSGLVKRGKLQARRVGRWVFILRAAVVERREMLAAKFPTTSGSAWSRMTRAAMRRTITETVNGD